MTVCHDSGGFGLAVGSSTMVGFSFRGVFFLPKVVQDTEVGDPFVSLAICIASRRTTIKDPDTRLVVLKFPPTLFASLSDHAHHTDHVVGLGRGELQYAAFSQC